MEERVFLVLRTFNVKNLTFLIGEKLKYREYPLGWYEVSNDKNNIVFKIEHSVFLQLSIRGFINDLIIPINSKKRYKRKKKVVIEKKTNNITREESKLLIKRPTKSTHFTKILSMNSTGHGFYGSGKVIFQSKSLLKHDTKVGRIQTAKKEDKNNDHEDYPSIQSRTKAQIEEQSVKQAERAWEIREKKQKR
jgi:hypothetical protein